MKRYIIVFVIFITSAFSFEYRSCGTNADYENIKTTSFWQTNSNARAALAENSLCSSRINPRISSINIGEANNFCVKIFRFSGVVFS